MRRRLRRIAVAAFVGLPLAAVFAALPAKGTTTLVSVNKSGTGGGDGATYYPSFSANGRYVLIDSFATDLVPNDTNGTWDVFVRDLKKGTTTLVSENAAGTAGGDFQSTYSSIAANGRFVAFDSEATDLVADDVNSASDIFLRDMKGRRTTLVSVKVGGTGAGNGGSFVPSISADGRFVTFYSNASNLIASDVNAKADVFLRDLRKGTTTLVSVNAAGTGSGNDGSFSASISADGRFVAFGSNANDLAPGNVNAKSNVYVRDVRKGTTTLVSVNAAGTGSGNAGSYGTAISANGRFVAFTSDASDLVAASTNGVRNVFVRDMKKGVTTLVSVNVAGTASGSGRCLYPAISGDGRRVAFASVAPDLSSADANRVSDVFVRDVRKGTTSLVSVASSGAAGGNSGSYVPALSADGRFVAFESDATDLAPGGNAHGEVFIRRIR